MSFDLVEAGLDITYGKNSSDRGTIYLDRTIYYTVFVKNSDGSVMIKSNGKPVVENRAYATAGRWLSQKAYDKALEVEQKFKKLNDAIRADEERRGINWKIPKSAVKNIEINGITN